MLPTCCAWLALHHDGAASNAWCRLRRAHYPAQSHDAGRDCKYVHLQIVPTISVSRLGCKCLSYRQANAIQLIVLEDTGLKHGHYGRELCMAF